MSRCEDDPKCRIERECVYYKIGTIIRRIRKELGMTQADLARKVGLKRPSMVLIEKGKQRLSVYRLYRIAWAMNVSHKKLLPKVSRNEMKNYEIDRIYNSLARKKITKEQMDKINKILDGE